MVVVELCAGRKEYFGDLRGEVVHVGALRMVAYEQSRACAALKHHEHAARSQRRHSGVEYVDKLQRFLAFYAGCHVHEHAVLGQQGVELSGGIAFCRQVSEAFEQGGCGACGFGKTCECDSFGEVAQQCGRGAEFVAGHDAHERAHVGHVAAQRCGHVDGCRHAHDVDAEIRGEDGVDVGACISLVALSGQASRLVQSLESGIPQPVERLRGMRVYIGAVCLIEFDILSERVIHCPPVV